MKHLYKFSLLLLVLLLPATVLAHDFEVDGIYYLINGNEATVTYKGSYSSQYNEYSGDVTIPATVTYGGTTYSVTSIGEWAFYSCRGLTSVTIPNSVTTIGNYAFGYCSSLTGISIPNSVASIGSEAFCGTAWYNNQPDGLVYAGLVAYKYKGTMPNGTSINLRDGTLSITGSAFSGCIGLTSITIPNSVTSISGSAFSGCSSLTNIVVASGNPNYDSRNNCNAIIETASNTLIVGCKNTTIPNSITMIGGGAFYRCSSLTSIYIPNSVTTIGNSAFSGCSGLTSIDIPNSVTSIGNNAFNGCSDLTSLSIGNSVISIGNSAFRDCSSLTSICIPNSVDTIGDYAFNGCSGLTSITVDTNNSHYDSRNNCNAIIETVSNTLILGCMNTVIPNSVTTIGNSAFSGCSGLTSIDIPNSVTSIGNNAFYCCTSLTSIDIPNSVTTIGNYAFGYCSSLTGINIPNSITEIGDNAFYNTPWLNDQPDGLLYIGQVAFKYIGSMPSGTSITLRDGTLGIAYYAFENCTGLTSIDIPNSVTSIGDGAFSNCTGLTSIDIPNSVTAIGEGAFYNCSGLTSISIPNSVTDLGDWMFADCTGLISINIPNSVISIGDNMFMSCASLIIIDIPNSVTSIGENAFDFCTSLTSIDIPNSVTTIGNYAFSNCYGLTSVIIPNSVTSIGDWAFSNCYGLTSITIGNSVTSIGESAFDYCAYSLTNINVANDNPNYDSRNNCNAIIQTNSNTLILGCKNTIIPNSVTSIGDYAFYGSYGLTSITIPNSITSIGERAFEECGLSSIHSFAFTPPTISLNSFCYDCIDTLFVPDIALDSYTSADYWNSFPNIVGMPYTFEVDGTSYHATSLSSASVMADDEGVLYSGEVVIPDSVTYEGMTFAVTGIESNAFDGCYELTSITIPNTVDSIGVQAFQGCTGLTSVTIGSGVTAIGAKAFNYCNALETVKCLGSVPPVMASADCFTAAAYNRATLLVPRNSEATYVATDYWYKFAHIDGWGSAGRGDVNGDGIMNIADVTALIDAMLNGDHENIYFESADLNSNGRLDIGDVTSLIDELLNGN